MSRKVQPTFNLNVELQVLAANEEFRFLVAHAVLDAARLDHVQLDGALAAAARRSTTPGVDEHVEGRTEQRAMIVAYEHLKVAGGVWHKCGQVLRVAYVHLLAKWVLKQNFVPSSVKFLQTNLTKKKVVYRKHRSPGYSL